ncbi:MAG: hypothetical protein M1814_001953 [Vezdaea aestivalis]|nr:MAG: hypothetical protein M1814_001953 [Vezdaea aestivalis]
MMRVQRRFGKFLPRTADESQVSVLLKDFDDVDLALGKIIDAARAWKDAWVSILRTQENLVSEFQGLYNPIIGASENYNGPEAVETPDETLERTSDLCKAYHDLKAELMEEINSVDSQIVDPATQARAYLQPLKKTIKKREDKKLDFERYSVRVDTATKKTKRSERENAGLAKSEKDLARATGEYQEADIHLKENLPPVVSAAFSILPHLLTNQILIQNALLAQYYTTLYTYCTEADFPSTTIPIEDVLEAWQSDFEPIKQQLETDIQVVSTGKSARLRPNDNSQSRIGMGSRSPSSRTRVLAPAPTQKLLKEPPSPAREPSLSNSTAVSGRSTPSSEYTTPQSAPVAFSPAAPRSDYFSRDRMPSQSSIVSVAAAAAAKKKKPPPPPPPKKKGLGGGAVYVTAMYDFGGESDGDLAFYKDDRIKVIKKTDSLEDWWEGELNGCVGSFPANYCE